MLQNRFEVPMIGVIEPGVRAALAVTRNKKIGVIGTVGTIASGAYERMILAQDPECAVFEVPCPLFVPLAEEGWIEGPVVEQVAHIYLDPLQGTGIDTLILGCTHYPLLKPAIGRILGPEVNLVDTAEETVSLVRQQLERLGLLRAEESDGRRKFFVSDIPAQFSQVGGRFLGHPIDEVEWVDQSEMPWYER